jgi:hypothetical protein
MIGGWDSTGPSNEFAANSALIWNDRSAAARTRDRRQAEKF